ncbi:cation:proton antiporter [Amycolatopsis alba]|nr:cation:proton antiporter [Amycolatopsis alba]
MHVVAALAAILALAWLGRVTAKALRQPEVIGEIVAGLFAGPVVVALFGDGTLGDLLPQRVLDLLKLIAEAGLALFLIGVAHKLRLGDRRPGRKASGWLAVCAFVPPLLTGGLLVAWIVAQDDPVVRGHAPFPAFLLMVAVAMSITAVPVLARILADHGLLDSLIGRLAMVSAILIDVAGWLLLSVAVGLASGSLAGLLRSTAVLVAGVLGALALRRVLRTPAATRLATRAPRVVAVALGVAAIAAALAFEHGGLTAVFGAVVLGLAVPAGADTPWRVPVASVTSAGRTLVPVFFVVTGVTVLTSGFHAAQWPLIALTVALGVVGKLGGGYLGARLGGSRRREAARAGVLMNTRGLTELIVLKVGFSAGILTAPLFLAMVIMALVATAMTGPCLLMLDTVGIKRGSPARTGSA